MHTACRTYEMYLIIETSVLNQPEKSVPPIIYFGKQCSFGGEGEIGGGNLGQNLSGQIKN